MPAIFSIGAIKVISVDHSAVFNVGENIVIGITSTHHNAQGSGGSVGDGIVEPSVGSTAVDNTAELGVGTTNPLAEGVNV